MDPRTGRGDPSTGPGSVLRSHSEARVTSLGYRPDQGLFIPRCGIDLRPQSRADSTTCTAPVVFYTFAAYPALQGETC